MAFAPHYDYSLVGSFVEKDHGKNFDYIENPEKVLHTPAHGGRLTHFPHLIFVGPQGEETRMALVLGNVAHVVTDETDQGFIIEKWNIKKHRKFQA